MSKHAPSTLRSLPLALAILLALGALAGCKEGDVEFDDGGFGLDGGEQAGSGGGVDSGAGGTGSSLDGGLLEPDAGGAAGSGGAGMAGGGGELDPNVVMLTDRLASATCAALSECVGDVDLLAELLGGRDCEQVTSGELRNGELSGLPAALDAERVLLDRSELDACADDLAALACDVRSRRWPASCELLLLGTVELGGQCAIDQECAGDAFCSLDDSCPGSCTALLAEDAACSNGDDDQCEDGLVCAAATDSCTALGANGDECGAGIPPCAPGLLCFDDGGGAQCTTVAVLYFRQLDETCLPGDGTCDPGVSACGDVELCEPGLVCESAASGGGLCRPPSDTNGSECKRAVPNQCPLEQVCDAEAPGEIGQCVDRPVAGEPCINRSPRCAPGHICVEDTCLELLDNGAHCDFSEECLSGICGEGGLCANPALYME